jgi:ubiquinone/menaquinone biosynthesis C-methylase UbiE
LEGGTIMRLHARLHGGAEGFEGFSATFYDFVASRLLRRVYRRLAQDVAAQAGEGATVLDIGTGPGVLLDELAKQRPDLTVTGVDRSADMVAAAQRKLARYGTRASAHTGDAADLPFTDGAFDLVVSSLSLHHWDRPAEAGRELARVLRPGGRICIYDVPAAPFDELVTDGRKPERTRLKVRIPFMPALVRVVVPAP